MAGYRRSRMTRCMADPDTERNTGGIEPAAAAAFPGLPVAPTAAPGKPAVLAGTPAAALIESTLDIAWHETEVVPKAETGTESRNAVAHKRAAHDALQIPYDRARTLCLLPLPHLSVPQNQASALANAHFHSYDTSPFHCRTWYMHPKYDCGARRPNPSLTTMRRK